MRLISFAWLGALGARTRRVEVGTSVATPTFRYHPSVVAQAFGTLGVMFPDRVVLGVGTGESLNEVPATGIKWPGFKERQGRLREAIALDAAVVDRGARHLRGPILPHRWPRRYTTARKSPVPIWIAASGPTAAAMAGEIAERVHLHQRQGRRALPRHVAAQGRGGAASAPAGQAAASSG